jgi:hypothetical protein
MTRHRNEQQGIPTLKDLLDQGRRRGYVRRDAFEAALKYVPPYDLQAHAEVPEPPGAPQPQLDERKAHDQAVEQLLAEDIDIVEDEEEEHLAQEDTTLEHELEALERESEPLYDLPDLEEVGREQLRRVEQIAQQAERGEAAEVDTITAYLREIGRVRMLTHQQEIALAQRLDAGDTSAM